MILLTANPISLSAAMLLASLLMVAAGVGKKRLRWRTTECPVCHRARPSCSCRWL